MTRPSISWALPAVLVSILCLAVLAPARPGDSRLPNQIMVLDGSPVHNVGELRLHMSNWGMFGSWPGSELPFAAAPSGEWPVGSGIEHVFADGLWVGALKSGVPAVSQAAYQFEFRPTSSLVDIVYYSEAGAPGGIRFPFPGADDDQDGSTDEEFLDGRDNDLDGAIDEDFAAISDQMLSRWYTDDQPEAVQIYPEHNPLGITVRERSYQWENDDYDDFVGVDYEITNTGNTLLEDVYVGVFYDGDVGDRDVANYYENDVAAFRRVAVCTERGGFRLDYGYMADELIGSGLAVLLLDHPIDPHGEWAPTNVHWSTFAAFSGTQPYEDGGDPTNDFERYELMSSQTIERDGTGGDYRILLSAGPFRELPPGATIKFTVALVAFPLADATNIRNAAIAYRGRWLNADEDPATGVEGRETQVFGPGEFIIDRCRPGYDQPVMIARGEELWINADCEQEDQYTHLCGYNDPELYATGVNGKEYHAHWVLPGDEIPTPVAIQRFEADHDGSAVNLSWEIWADEEVAGYDLLRAAGSGSLLRLADGLPAGTNRYRDESVVPGTRYEYQLIARGVSGWTAVSPRVGVEMPALSLTLDNGAPNPFRSSTILRFTIPERSTATLSVFDAAGRRVTTLFSKELPAGTREITWNGTDDSGRRLSAGVYFCRLEAGKGNVTRKLLLLQ